MILKFHSGWETWKYIDGITNPEVEVTNEFELASRLGYTIDRMKELGIEVGPDWRPKGEGNTLSLLNRVQPISDMYFGELDWVLFKKGSPVEYAPGCCALIEATEEDLKPTGCLVLAITCSVDGKRMHIFTDCETYLLNDNGKTLNRLL